MASADTIDQSIQAQIAPDGSVTGVWNIPVTTAAGTYLFPEFQNFGSTGLMSYNLKSVSDEHGNLTLNSYPGGYTVNLPPSTSAVSTLTAQYDVTSALTKPVAIYEFWISNFTIFFAPKVTVTYPPGWKVLGAWPTGVTAGDTVTMTYPTGTPYVQPALLIMQPPDLGLGNTVVTNGRFTFIGSVNDVQKLQTAASKLTFVDDLFQNSLGIPAPSSVTVYASDLSGADVGYEAIALAAKPNLILYNKDLLAKQTTQEIETTLVHEMTHLAEGNQNLFNGAVYIAPWFREGLAVFMENQARPLIFSDISQQSVDDLTGQTHMFSADELQQRYKTEFDYLFQGEFHHPVTESYSLSGVVLTNFFQKAGVTGMQKLFSMLKNANSAQLSDDQDSTTILTDMSTITGLSTNDLLFPHKTDSNFAQAVATLTHPDYGSAGDDAMVNYIQHTISPYFNGDSVANTQSAVAPTVSQSAVPTVKNTTTSTVSGSCPQFTRNLSRGMNGADVRSLQQFLNKQGTLPASGVIGTFGPMTERAVSAWQTTNGITGAPGFVGQKTRAAILSTCSAGTSTSTSSAH